MAKGDGFAVCTMKKQSGGGGGLSAHIDREVYSPELDRMVPFRPASVRDDSRTALNRECIESTVKIGRTQAIWKRLSTSVTGNGLVIIANSILYVKKKPGMSFSSIWSIE